MWYSTFLLGFGCAHQVLLVGHGPTLDANVGLGTTAMSGLFLLQKICSPIRLQSSSVKAWLINERSCPGWGHAQLRYSNERRAVGAWNHVVTNSCHMHWEGVYMYYLKTLYTELLSMLMVLHSKTMKMSQLELGSVHSTWKEKMANDFVQICNGVTISARTIFLFIICPLKMLRKLTNN